MTKTNLDNKIESRCTKFEKAKIRFLAKKYANGNMSLLLIYSAMNVPQENLKELITIYKDGLIKHRQL